MWWSMLPVWVLFEEIWIRDSCLRDIVEWGSRCEVCLGGVLFSFVVIALVAINSSVLIYLRVRVCSITPLNGPIPWSMDVNIYRVLIVQCFGGYKVLQSLPWKDTDASFVTLIFRQVGRVDFILLRVGPSPNNSPFPRVRFRGMKLKLNLSLTLWWELKAWVLIGNGEVSCRLNEAGEMSVMKDVNLTCSSWEGLNVAIWGCSRHVCWTRLRSLVYTYPFRHGSLVVYIYYTQFDQLKPQDWHSRVWKLGCWLIRLCHFTILSFLPLKQKSDIVFPEFISRNCVPCLADEFATERFVNSQLGEQIFWTDFSESHFRNAWWHSGRSHYWCCCILLLILVLGCPCLGKGCRELSYTLGM